MTTDPRWLTPERRRLTPFSSQRWPTDKQLLAHATLCDELLAERDAEILKLKERLLQSKKLYELTLNNEIRWMRMHEKLTEAIAEKNEMIPSYEWGIQSVVDGIVSDRIIPQPTEEAARDWVTRFPASYRLTRRLTAGAWVESR